MTLVLRIVRQPRWDSPGTFGWLADGDIPADPLADFANTSDNSLSVWFIDDNRRDLDDVLAALAASREKADKLDYVLFRQDHLQFAGIEAREKSGNTPDEHTNRLHRDLIHLSAAKVLALTTKVWNEKVGLERLDARRALQLVADAVRCGRVSLERLRPKLRDDVRSCLAAPGEMQRKPK